MLAKKSAKQLEEKAIRSKAKWNILRWSSVGLLVALTLIGRYTPVSAQDALTADDGEVVADGFNAPQGLLVDDDGSVLVIDSGTGGDETITIFSSQAMTDVEASMGDTARIVRVAEDGTKADVADLPSLLVGMEAVGGARLAKVGDQLYATVGQFSSTPDTESLPNFAVIAAVGDDGSLKTVASGWDYERSTMLTKPVSTIRTPMASLPAPMAPSMLPMPVAIMSGVSTSRPATLRP